jgi:hypothetical protein
MIAQYSKTSCLFLEDFGLGQFCFEKRVWIEYFDFAMTRTAAGFKKAN